MSWAIILYGSRARGSGDPESDVDLLALGRPPEPVLRQTHDRYPGELSLSAYDWDEFDAMRADGSIFLRHIAMEGRVLAAEGRGAHVLDELANLPPYRHVDRDLASFSQTLTDVQESLADGGSPTYEMAVVLGMIRHCAILGSYLLGRVGFGITGPLDTIKPICSLDDTRVSAFHGFYRRVTRHRLSRAEQPTTGDVLGWHAFAGDVLTCVKGLRSC
jgi:hypothetical protein